MYFSDFHDCSAPDFRQFFQRIRCIGRACGRQFFHRKVQFLILILPVKFSCSFSVGINLPDLRFSHDFPKIRRNHIFDTAVARPDDTALFDHIIHGNASPEKHLFFLFHRLWLLLFQHCRQHLPEPIPWMPVEKCLFSRFYRRKTSKDKDS